MIGIKVYDDYGFVSSNNKWTVLWYITFDKILQSKTQTQINTGIRLDTSSNSLTTTIFNILLNK